MLPHMRAIKFVEGEYYHLYNRGVDKRNVFTEPKEYKRFLAYLYMLNSSRGNVRPSDFFRTNKLEDAFEIEREDCLVALGAFCLMPNHFHLYATPLTENGISKFMQRLETAYTKYFNEKHNRTGALFGSTFKAEHVSSDRYARYLFSYIHLNPAKLRDRQWKTRKPNEWRQLKKYVQTYPYSSCREYFGQQYVITEPNRFPTYLRGKTNVGNHISEWLKYGVTARSLASRD
jgi:REP element-mobilizing transposase RayT